MKFDKLNNLCLLAGALCVIATSCTKKEPSSYSVSEQQYLLFDQIDKKQAPAIIGNTFFTKEGDQTKIRVFYYSEAIFPGPRPAALYENDVVTGGNKIMDIPPITSPRAGYTEVLLDVPYEQAITNSYHLLVQESTDNDSIIAATDMGVSGFKGQEYNLSYPLSSYGDNIERGTLLLWQRRDESFYVNVAMDTMLVGKQYVIDVYEGDTSSVNTQKWLGIGDIPNTVIGQKYKVADISTTTSGTKLNFDLLKTSDIHIEVRRMPENVIVAKAIAGKYKP
jgi:hypothetical protein